MKKKICLIEDEDDIVRLITYNLEQEGFDVVSYNTGHNVVDFVIAQKPELVLLDVMIPENDGFECCKQLKANPKTATIPIIILSAKSQEANIVTGLELGANDYITKPFSVAILIARIRSVLRHKTIPNPPSSDETTMLQLNGIRLYPDLYEAYIGDTLIDLNHTEFKLLYCLMEKPGRVFSRSQIIESLRGSNYFVTKRLVDVLLVSLRKKLQSESSCIQTVRGVGYKIKVKS